jgi:hypothetical protein
MPEGRPTKLSIQFASNGSKRSVNLSQHFKLCLRDLLFITIRTGHSWKAVQGFDINWRAPNCACHETYSRWHSAEAFSLGCCFRIIQFFYFIIILHIRGTLLSENDWHWFALVESAEFSAADNLALFWKLCQNRSLLIPFSAQLNCFHIQQLRLFRVFWNWSFRQSHTMPDLFSIVMFSVSVVRDRPGDSFFVSVWLGFPWSGGNHQSAIFVDWSSSVMASQLSDWPKSWNHPFFMIVHCYPRQTFVHGQCFFSVLIWIHSHRSSFQESLIICSVHRVVYCCLSFTLVFNFRRRSSLLCSWRLYCIFIHGAAFVGESHFCALFACGWSPELSVLGDSDIADSVIDFHC